MLDIHCAKLEGVILKLECSRPHPHTVRIYEEIQATKENKQMEEK